MKFLITVLSLVSLVGCKPSSSDSNPQVELPGQVNEDAGTTPAATVKVKMQDGELKNVKVFGFKSMGVAQLYFFEKGPESCADMIKLGQLERHVILQFTAKDTDLKLESAIRITESRITAQFIESMLDPRGFDQLILKAKFDGDKLTAEISGRREKSHEIEGKFELVLCNPAAKL